MPYSIYLSPPHPTGSELSLLAEVISQNWIAPAGPHLNLLEQKIEGFLGDNNYVTALQSGTAAIHLGLKLLGVTKGDVVLCQSLTFVASVNPVLYVGAIPVFIDSEATTWNLSPDLLEQAIKDQLQQGVKPKAIIAVHLYGMPYQSDEINRISKEYGIPVLEDSAEALGSFYKEKACGTLGDLSIFSFNGNKIITTGGGGALVSKTHKEKQYALKLATQAKEEEAHFEHRELGYNYRMSNLNAAVGCAQWEALEKFVEKRRAIFLFYQNELKNRAELSFLEEPKGFFSNRWLTVVLSQHREQREQIRKVLNSQGIEARPVWKPLHLQPLFSSQKSYVNGISESVFERGLCLPSGSNLTEEQLYTITKLIRKAL